MHTVIDAWKAQSFNLSTSLQRSLYGNSWIMIILYFALWLSNLHCLGIENHNWELSQLSRFIIFLISKSKLTLKKWSFIRKFSQNISIKLIHWLCQSFNLYMNYLSKYTTSSHNYITCSFLNRIKVRECGCARDYICHDFAFLLPWIFYVNTIYMYVHYKRDIYVTCKKGALQNNLDSICSN